MAWTIEENCHCCYIECVQIQDAVKKYLIPNTFGPYLARYHCINSSQNKSKGQTCHSCSAIIPAFQLLQFSLMSLVSNVAGLLPCASPPGAAHDQCNAASGLHPQCDHRAEETGRGPGRGGDQVGVTENQRSSGLWLYA